MWAVHPCRKPWVEAIQLTSAAPRAKHLEVPQELIESSLIPWIHRTTWIPQLWRLISGSESQAPSNLPRFTVRPSPEVGYSTGSLPDYQLHPNLWHVVGASNSKLVHSWPRPWPKQTWKTLSTRREAHDKHVKNLEAKGYLAWPKRPSTSGLANLCERIFKLSKQVCDARTNIETCLTRVGTASVYHLLKDGNNSGASEIDPHAVLWTP